MMIMNRWLVLAFGAVLWASWMPMAGAVDAHRLGVGANYWVALDDIDVSDVDDNGFSYSISYQYRPHVLGLQVDVEFLPDRFGEDAVAPQAYLVLGRSFYAAAGVGMVYWDGDWADDPFFALKAGFDMEMLPGIYLDISANYRFSEKTELKDSETDIDTDTIFLGAAVRIGF